MSKATSGSITQATFERALDQIYFTGGSQMSNIKREYIRVFFRMSFIRGSKGGLQMNAAAWNDAISELRGNNRDALSTDDIDKLVHEIEEKFDYFD